MKKKIIWIVVILVIAAAVTQCGGSKEDEPTADPNANSQVEESANTDVEQSNAGVSGKSEQPQSQATSGDVESTQPANSAANAAQSGSVDPQLKAFLDSYEAFVDEYVAFMKRYKADPNNAVAMLDDYSKMMAKYVDFADKVNQYDSKSMSAADAKYYLEVTTRCSKKLLEVS